MMISTEALSASRRPAFSPSSSVMRCCSASSEGAGSDGTGRTRDAVPSSSPNSATSASQTALLRGYTQQRRSGSQR